MDNGKIEIIDAVGMDIIQAQERASIDSQVATAKRYPRSLRKVTDNSISIVCMNKETAQSCRYSKPTGGKKATGPSVHLARIVVQQYGNIKVQQRIKQITDKTIIAEAVAFDMETNYAVCVEARRSIIDRNGKRFSDSNIETNAMAVMAIAERNAILKIIPKSIIDTVYDEAFKFANGDLSDNAQMIIARDKALLYFKTEHGVDEESVLNSIGLRTKESIKAEHIVDLRGYMQALIDKEVKVEDLFGVDEKQNRNSNNTELIIDQKDPVKPGPKQVNLDEL